MYNENNKWLNLISIQENGELLKKKIRNNGN